MSSRADGADLLQYDATDELALTSVPLVWPPAPERLEEADCDLRGFAAAPPAVSETPTPIAASPEASFRVKEIVFV
jgi:hypothetical protein